MCVVCTLPCQISAFSVYSVAHAKQKCRKPPKTDLKKQIFTYGDSCTHLLPDHDQICHKGVEPMCTILCQIHSAWQIYSKLWPLRGKNRQCDRFCNYYHEASIPTPRPMRAKFGTHGANPQSTLTCYISSESVYSVPHDGRKPLSLPYFRTNYSLCGGAT